MGVGAIGGADYDGENFFCINEPSYAILTQWGKFSTYFLLEMHVKDMMVYECSHLTCMPEQEVVGSI